MEVIVERPAALDVHNASVMACVRVPGEGRRRVEHVAEFQTTAHGLPTLRDWLEAHEVDQVAMEATGSTRSGGRSCAPCSSLCISPRSTT
jgi:transposase